jgi:hypothetical protein
VDNDIWGAHWRMRGVVNPGVLYDISANRAKHAYRTQSGRYRELEDKTQEHIGMLGAPWDWGDSAADSLWGTLNESRHTWTTSADYTTT